MLHYAKTTENFLATHWCYASFRQHCLDPDRYVLSTVWVGHWCAYCLYADAPRAQVGLFCPAGHHNCRDHLLAFHFRPDRRLDRRRARSRVFPDICLKNQALEGFIPPCHCSTHMVRLWSCSSCTSILAIGGVAILRSAAQRGNIRLVKLFTADGSSDNRLLAPDQK